QDESGKIVASPAFLDESDADRLEAPVAKVSRLPRNRPLVNAQQLCHFALAHTVAQAQPQDEQLVLGKAAQGFARGEAKNIVPPGVGVFRQGERYVVLDYRMNLTAMAELRDVPVLEDANQPGDQRTLTIVPGQDGRAVLGL